MLKCSTLQSKITYANTAVGINYPYQSHGQYVVREIPCHLSQINTRMGNPVARHLCLNCKTKTQPCSRAQQRCRVDQSVDVCQSNAMLIENRQQWPWPPVRSEPVSSRCYRRRRAWTEGAVVLGRRGAPACSGGGQPGADGKRNNVQGWTVFETPSTWGPCRPLDQERAAQIGRGLRLALGRPLQVGTGARRGVARARRRAPGGRRGFRSSCRSSRDTLWAKESAGLRRRRLGGRQAAWTCRLGEVRAACGVTVFAAAAAGGRPAPQVAPLVSP